VPVLTFKPRRVSTPFAQNYELVFLGKYLVVERNLTSGPQFSGTAYSNWKSLNAWSFCCFQDRNLLEEISYSRTREIFQILRDLKSELGSHGLLRQGWELQVMNKNDDSTTFICFNGHLWSWSNMTGNNLHAWIRDDEDPSCLWGIVPCFFACDNVHRQRLHMWFETRGSPWTVIYKQGYRGPKGSWCYQIAMHITNALYIL